MAPLSTQRKRTTRPSAVARTTSTSRPSRSLAARTKRGQGTARRSSRPATHSARAARTGRPPSLRSRAAPIVVGVDFTDASHDALEAAVRYGRDLGAPVIIVHAATPLDPPGLVDAPPLGAPGLDLSHPGTVTPAYLQPVPQAAEWAARVRAHGVDAVPVERPGDAAQLILEEAETRGAQMIIVGCRDRPRFKELVLGSVSSKVMAKASCPVLVIPTREPLAN